MASYTQTEGPSSPYTEGRYSQPAVYNEGKSDDKVTYSTDRLQGRKVSKGCCTPATKKKVAIAIALIIAVALITFGALLLFCPPVAVGLGLAAMVKLPTVTLFVIPTVTKAIAAASIGVGAFAGGVAIKSALTGTEGRNVA